MVDKVSYNPSFGAYTVTSKLTKSGNLAKTVGLGKIINTPVENDAQITDFFEKELKDAKGIIKTVEVDTTKISDIMKWIGTNIGKVEWHSASEKGLIGKPVKKVLSVMSNAQTSTYRISDVLADGEEGALVSISVPAQTVKSVLAQQAKAVPTTKPAPNVLKK